MSSPDRSRVPGEVTAPDDLASILRPVEVETFLATDYGQKSVYVPGTPGKFSALLPWPVLNDILEQHRLEPPRVRLTREGKPVPAERYLSFRSNRRGNGRPIPRLNSAELTRELREGATLVLDNVDELYRPIRRLSESLERVFRVRIQVNSYSGWRSSHGFDVHWDDHDVFVLQVAGRKRWSVYGTTRPYPLGRDIEPAVDAPKELLWEQVLQDGDLLYIPRGWWHLATPLEEPTLHLTVGVNNPTTADFLSWFVDRLRSSEIVLRDVPFLRGPAAIRDHAERVRQALFSSWHPGLMDEYMAHLDAHSAARPHFGLPWSATDDVLPPGTWRAQWSGHPRVKIEATGDELTLTAFGRRWKFVGAARPLLDLVVSGRECTEDDFRKAANGSLSSKVVREFIRELAANGLVVVH